ncbi:amidohydrolase [Streptomyces melanogenes]|uniref:amidohydrolase n=1 Tax=Streptomyces melanogenes TaxID=67326 RepID=UPI0019C40B9B|nr:amidohydrolase [Streptomyces melanogenes]GGP33018.1 amidohydrolase [Streptomyces melanogenes]
MAATGPAVPDVDAIYFGGDIVTVDAARPTAEAVAVRDGRIAAVGRLAEVLALAGPGTEMVDLGGRTLLPGFVDAHSHVSLIGFQAGAANLLPPPDGPVDDIAALRRELEAWTASESGDRWEWIVGFGYDDAQLAGREHPTRDDLDEVSRDRPVLVIHQSSHLGAVNSKALELLGFDAESQDPKGGVIRRRPDSTEPNGVLEEAAFFQAWGLSSKDFDDEERIRLVLLGQRAMAAYGFTTAQDGRVMSLKDLEILESAAAQGLLDIDVVAYPDVSLAEHLKDAEVSVPEYRGRLRIGGVKVGLDGSPQGRTAWLTRPYLTPPGDDPRYRGYPAMTDDAVVEAVGGAYAKGWQVLAHVNGDAAIDQFVMALRQATTRHRPADPRPVAVHAQTAREDQLDAMKELGVIPSFFSMHTFYWGDWYRETVLGEERAARISPAASALKRGMVYTSHHDGPVALPSSLAILSSQVTRTTRSGHVLGEDQRVAPLDAVRATTLHAAHQYFEEATKGSIAVGKLADLVVLSANPLRVRPEQIKDIRVLRTLKEGRTVYVRQP